MTIAEQVQTYVLVDGQLYLTQDVARHQDVSEMKQYVRADLIESLSAQSSRYKAERLQAWREKYENMIPQETDMWDEFDAAIDKAATVPFHFGSRLKPK